MIRTLGLLSAAALAMVLHAGAATAQPIELKLAYFVGDQHAMSQWLVKWANKLEQAIATVLANGLRTKDIAQSSQASVGTKQMGDAILAELRSAA